VPVARSSCPPLVVVDTADLTREEWLSCRRQGIGGSDAASVLGVSPFTTARDLYYDKRGIVSAVEDDRNWAQLEVGHLLEDLVARIFAKKTGYRIFQMKKMFRHPVYTFMLADLDFLIELPNKAIAILEIKTTNYNAKDKWWDVREEIVPLNYVLQGRHYMAVMDIDQIFYCCLYGNNEDEVIIRHLNRDLEFESEMIALEEDFWVNHVLAQVPPPYTEDGDLVSESVRRHFGAADRSVSEVHLDSGFSGVITRYLKLQEEKRSIDAQANWLKGEMDRMKGCIIAEMGTSCAATCESGSVSYCVTYNPVIKSNISKNDMIRLRAQHPDIYDEYVTTNESRMFRVKSVEKETA
jgi:putative phage-type endonuclease